MAAELDEIRRSIEDSLRRLDAYVRKIKEEKERAAQALEEKLEELKITGVDLDELKRFLQSSEPYVLIPRKRDVWWVIVPKFVKLHVGWLEYETETFRIFAVNRYMGMVFDLPKNIKEKLRIPEPMPITVSDGYLVTEPDVQEDVWKRYRAHLLRRESGGRIRVKRGHEFHLIARIIEDGSLPFVPKPVQKEDLREWKGISLYPHQKRAWKAFLRWGAVGIYWPPGAGKSFFGVYVLARVRGKKLVVVPTLTLKEQWEERIKELIPESQSEVDIVTYLGYEKVKDREYSLVIYDECHRLPANSYVRLATVRAKYRLGLSATPMREDGRESYIFALTGYPIGMNWDELIQQGFVNVPVFRLYIVRNLTEKMKRVEELLRLPLKTVIFCDSIELGRKLSTRLGVPFVHGGTRDRLEIIRNNDVVVVSRVGDEGVSIGDIERVIEVDFLYGSRRQEAQRYGRLMHSQKREPQHIVIMTEKEFKLYQKRLYAITEKGFRIEVIR